LVLTGDHIDADEAYRIGFLQKLVPYDQLDAAVEAWLTSLLACGPRARFLTPAGTTVQVLKASLRPEPSGAAPGVPGAIGPVEPGKGFFVRFSGGSLFLEELKPEGRGPVGAAAFLNGARLGPGDALIVPPAGNEGPEK
ncbi:MAG: hypothetical protein RQ748_05590, partial [Elusimicrobiales bacterium]|nr:hypothetical protein [Elusimicrobiales bacterium]